MTVDGINGLLAYGALEETRSVSRRRLAVSQRASNARVNRTPDSQQEASAPSATNKSSSEVSDSKAPPGPGNLNEAEKREVERLRARDGEVRAHEQAHKAVAGAHARGGPSYTTTRGPDGRSYATEGSVSINTSAVPDDPEKTLAKMQQVRRAALAPSDPSAQDARVAAEAAQKANEARVELAQSRQDDTAPSADEDGDVGHNGVDHAAGALDNARPPDTIRAAEARAEVTSETSQRTSAAEQRYPPSVGSPHNRRDTGAHIDLHA